MASNRARLLSSRQRQRYRARHDEKLRQVKAEREREGKIADVMFGVEQTLRANRAGQDAAQVGLEALGKITTLMQDSVPRRPKPSRANGAGAASQLPPLESPTKSPNRLAATYPAPAVGLPVPSRPENAKFRAQNPLYGRDTRYKAPKSHSLSPPPRPARAAWGPQTGSPLAPVARPTDLTRPSPDGARPHYVLTRRMKPSLLKPLTGSGGHRRRRRRHVPAGGFDISPPRFTGPPRRLAAKSLSPQHRAAADTKRKPEPEPEPSPRPEVPAPHEVTASGPSAPKAAQKKAASVVPSQVTQAEPPAWQSVKRVAMRVGGHLVLVRVSAAAGSGWPMKIAVSTPRGGIGATAVMAKDDVAGAVGHDVASPAAVASNAHLLRAVVSVACPAAAVSALRTCRRVDGRALAINITVKRGTVRVHGLDVVTGDTHELELAATDAGWLLGESTAASLGGLDQAQLARLASLVVIDSDGSIMLRRLVTKVEAARIDGAGGSTSNISVCVEQVGAPARLACAFVGTCQSKGWTATLRVPLDRLTVDVSPDGSDLAHAAQSAVDMLAWHQQRDGSQPPTLRMAL